MLPTPWILCPYPNVSADSRLFCFPYAGSGASVYRAWQGGLPANVELLPIQLPGRENRMVEKPLDCLSRLCDTVVDVLGPYFEPPFAFFGHSLGALIAFELTRELRHRGLPLPTALFVSGREAPRVLDLDPPLHPLPEDAFIRELCQRYGGIPQEVLEEPELLKLLIPALRADLTMNETYGYVEKEPLACPIYAYGGLQDARVSRADLDAWQRETRDTFIVRMFPGGHFFIQSARDRVLQELSEDLQQVLAVV